MQMSLSIAALAGLCALSAACKQRETDPGTYPPPHDAESASPLDAASDATKAMPDVGGAGLKPLALGCSSNAECASGNCVDSVCCDTACDGQCSACNLTGTTGYCTPKTSGDDTASVDPCTGAHTCSVTFSFVSLPACRLKDLQACTANADCASLHCLTFYVDRDGDGYGQSGNTIQLCEEEGAAPPVGYSALAGDCCDADGSAHPGQTKFFGVTDVCGSWDYDCDGKVVAQDGFPPAFGCSEAVQEGDTSYLEPTTCH